MLAPRILIAATAAVLAALPAERALAQATDGTVVRVAGTTPGFAGDGGPATAAQLNEPADVAVVGGNGIAIADLGNDRIRLVRPDGTIVTIAGSTRGYSGDDGPADQARLNRPAGVTALPDGGILIADSANNRIRQVTPDGTITTAAGGRGTRSGQQTPPQNQPGAEGDGGPATAAALSAPADTMVLPGGGYLIVDTGNHRIRRVSPDGTITTFAGTTAGLSGDGGPASQAQLRDPTDVELADDGSILVADTGNDRIRRIERDGTITTVAGARAFDGDPDQLLGARLSAPRSVIGRPNGGLLIADTNQHRIRRLTPLGTIFTVAGTFIGGGGDGGAARTAQFNRPGALAEAPGGGFFVVDTGNATVRRVTGFGAVPPAVLQRSVRVAPAAGAVTVQPLGREAFLPLREDDLVQLSSVMDATAGRIELQTAQNLFGVQQTAQAYDAQFVVRQLIGATPLTDLRLPPLSGCGTTAAPRVSVFSPTAQRRKRKRKRRYRGPKRALWVTERGGNWRTSTGSVAVAAIGTLWRTTLRCDGTLVTVREGRVAVRDKNRLRTRVLRPGQSYFARTPRRRGI